MRFFVCFLLFWSVVNSAAAAPTPHRIVSLAPGTTEMLFALGLGPRIVGDTVYCDYPAAARTIAKIGDVNVNYEKVLSLHPDLIVASDANRPAAIRLQKLHLPVLMIAPTGYLATEQSLRQIGAATGTQSRARHVIAQMENARRSAAGRAANDHRTPSVLPLLGLNPLYVAGSGTFIGDLIALAGGHNNAAISGYAPYARERVLTQPPDFVLADPKLQAALRADPILHALPSVRAGRFISIVPPEILERPGPRLAIALLQISRALHPGTH